jgi:hypothetical protein
MVGAHGGTGLTRRRGLRVRLRNPGGPSGATIDHPHSQIMAFGTIPPIPEAELSAGTCDFCQEPGDDRLSSAALAGGRAVGALVAV